MLPGFPGPSIPRRSFLQVAAAGFAGGAQSAASAAEPAPPPQPTSATARFFAYGYDKEPYPLEPGPHLFIDWRYVQCGRVNWHTADGKDAPLFAFDEIKGVQGTPRVIPSGIRLITQKAERVGPIIANDREWEFMIGGYCSLHDLGGKFGLWYEVAPPRTQGEANLLCYAESQDGIHWTKPELGLVEFNGSRKNNIVIDGQRCPYGSFHGNSVFVDPTAPADERFKVIYMAILKDGGPIARVKQQRPWSVSPLGEVKKAVIQYASSPDGLQWKFNDEIILVHQSDTQTTVYYDSFLKKYVGYYRTILLNRRAIGRAETTDLRQWPVPESILWTRGDEDPADDYYDNSKSIYPGTRTMHLLFPTIYRRRVDGCSMAMMSSLDGAMWDWVPGGDVLETGPQGSWDAGCLFGGCGLTEISGDRVVLPYGGFHFPHKYPRWGRIGQLGLAVWKKSGLVALEAPEEGEFWTQQLHLPPGNALYLNYETSQAGYVKVELSNVLGHTLEDCDPLIGDAVKARVTWKSQSALSIKPGHDVTLRFRMRAAKLYSFEVK